MKKNPFNINLKFFLFWIKKYLNLDIVFSRVLT